MRDVFFAIGAGVMLGLGALAASRVAYGGTQHSSHEEARSQTKVLVQIVNTWRLNHPNELDRCPSVAVLELQGLLRSDQNIDDPWGNPYVIFCPHDDDLAVISAGPDGRYGTEDDIKAGDVP